MEPIEFEQLQPEFLGDDRLQPPIKLTCLTLPGFRAYAYVQKDEKTGRDLLRVAPGITSVLDKTVTQEWKCDWYGRVGLDEATRILTERANFGTLLHGQAAQFDIDHLYNFDEVEDIVTAFLESHPMPFSVNVPAWCQELSEDMASYIRWSQIINFEPIAVELPLVSSHYHVASRIDKIGWVDIGDQGYYASGAKKYQPKGDVLRVLVIVDIKSSRKNHSTPANPLQLLFYEALFKESFPEFQNQRLRLWNWSPNGWVTGPEYTFHEHFVTKKAGVIVPDTEVKAAALRELRMCVDLFHLRHSWRKNRVRFFGTFDAKTDGQDITTYYRRESYLELLADELAAELPEELRAFVS